MPWLKKYSNFYHAQFLLLESIYTMVFLAPPESIIFCIYCILALWAYCLIKKFEFILNSNTRQYAKVTHIYERNITQLATRCKHKYETIFLCEDISQALNFLSICGYSLTCFTWVHFALCKQNLFMNNKDSDCY
jgi:hypothetical protein